jgi:hypothetical protein
MYSNVKTSSDVSNYQPVAWVLYQRVIDQSKVDIFIKPGITYNVLFQILKSMAVSHFLK